MSINVRTGLLVLSLLVPLASQAQQCISTGKYGLRACDFTFTAVPAFTNLCIAQIQGGTYTIRNNTPVPVKLNYIRIQNNDALPAAATSIVAAPTSSCVAGNSLASGATCNILLNLLPLSQGTFSRVLQVGIDTRQVELDGTSITSAVLNCTPGAPSVPPVPTPPAPTPGPSTLYQASILGASTVTNTGPSAINGDVDVSPGTAITGFPPGTIVNGTTHAADATAATAQANALAYYNSAVGQACPGGNNLTGQDLGGKTLAPGVYCFSSSAQLTGALTLSGGPTSSYTFQIGSTLTTASNSSVILSGGVTNGNVTWAVGSSATLGTGTAFQGIIDAVASITLNTGASLAGRAWALNGAVTLDSNAVNPN
ncbi:MAG: ice-binding family protein [Gammaproteobacteria bacterium]|nr:ice-binding family protein [Gammaproteobacteria bacterium]